MSGGRYGESEKWEMRESKKIGKKVRDLDRENGVGSRAIKKRLKDKKEKHMREREKSGLERKWGFQRGLSSHFWGSIDILYYRIFP